MRLKREKRERERERERREKEKRKRERRERQFEALVRRRFIGTERERERERESKRYEERSGASGPSTKGESGCESENESEVRDQVCAAENKPENDSERGKRRR